MNRYYFQACYKLITESEQEINHPLDEDVESYVVRLTADKFDDPSLGYNKSVIEMKYAPSETTLEKYKHLKDTGDTCLLISSLTPFVAQRFGLSPSYFISIGKDAFYELGKDIEPSTNVYTKIYQQFSYVRDVVENAFTHKMYSIEQLIVLGKVGSSLANKILLGTDLSKGFSC
jgi:hypothetical protein